MAADVVLDPQPQNPCCAELKKKYLKLEEKRNALRQAVKLLEAQAGKLQKENAVLKEVCEEERKRANLAQQAKESFSNVKSTLEKEIQDLKLEITSLQENRSFIDKDRIQKEILQNEQEIKRLNGLLQKEIKRAESEKKKVLDEKKKATEALELLKIEKSKAEEEKRLAEMERKKAEDISHSLAKARLESSEARSKMIEERKKAEAANKKLELERKKTSTEKKCTGIERARVEEQVELAEVERKKAMVEKERADNLSKQLQEERKRREELQKKMEETLFCLPSLKCSPGHCKRKQLGISRKDNQFSNINRLKSKLKLRKNELKQVRRKVKLEKMEKHLLVQQLDLLKQDHFRFTHRLEMLINFASSRTEGTDGFTEVGGSIDKCTKCCSTETQRKCVCPEHVFNSQVKSKINCTAMRCMDPVTSHTWHWSEQCGRRCTRSFSGISSDLESPVGISVGNKKQNSALCSTAVTYSDSPLMGSQGRSPFAVATSAKCAKERFRRSPSVNLTSQTKIMPVAQEGNDGSRQMQIPLLKSGTEVTSGDFQFKGKRKAEATPNAECYTTCLNISSKNSLLKDLNLKSFSPMICGPDDISDVNAGKSVATEFSYDSNTRDYKARKKMRDKHAKLGPQSSNHIFSHGEAREYEGDGPNKICCINEAALHFPDAEEHSQTCRNKSRDISINNWAAVVCLENMIPDDFMKLLDLEDDAEEQKYRAAKARPLSPTLPELESPSRSHSIDDHHSSRCCSKEEKKALIFKPQSSQSASSSQEHLDPNSIIGKINSCDTSGCIYSDSSLLSTLQRSELPPDGAFLRNAGTSSFESVRHRGEPCDQGVSHCMNADNILEKNAAVDGENYLSGEKGAHNSNLETKMSKQESLHKATELECTNHENGDGKRTVHGCFVIFSNTKDEQAISRILCARNSIVHDTLRGGNSEFSLVLVFHALAANLDISSEEKACILLSLFLCKVSCMIPVDVTKQMDVNLSSVSEFVITEMHKVSDDDIRAVFSKTSLLDIFVSFIQDFITARKVLVCGDESCEQSDLGTPFYLDNENRTWSLKSAGVIPLVAGSVILATISSMHASIEILWQTSLELILKCQRDRHWILTAVHVFASIYGAKFFSQTDQHLILTSIKSLIVLIEKKEENADQDKCLRFPLCKECPFAEGQVCPDKVVTSLLGNLQNCIARAAREQGPNELMASCNLYDRHDYHNNGFDVSPEECNATCSLRNFACQLDHDAEESFCQFIDIVSLVELFGYYMEWGSVHSKIIKKLFTLLELCPSPAFSVSLLVVIGHLGRSGIENSDRGQSDVESLMFSLLTFLDMDIAQKNGLCVQLAAISALLNLLPLDFREIVEGPLSISSETSQIVFVERIGRWFHHLGDDQKAMSLRFFQNSK